MLFLLRNHRGTAILIAHAPNKVEADEYGRAHVPDFCGESLELELESRTHAEEFWGVRTVEVSGRQSGATAVKTVKAAKQRSPLFTMTHVWVRGLELPDGLLDEDFLTDEDRRDLALDHIARTSDFVGRIEIRKSARG